MVEIRPHVGIGKIRFGASIDEVGSAIGGELVLDPDPPEGWICMDFPAACIKFAFDQELGERLVQVSSENPRSTLDGAILVGIPTEAALAAADRCGLGTPEREDYGITWQAEFSSKDLSLWFADGICTSVSWMIRFANDGDTPLWPLRKLDDT